MKWLCFALSAAWACTPLASAQTPLPLTFNIYNGPGNTPALPSTYQFPDTPQYGSSSIVVQAVNTSSSAVCFVDSLVSDATNSTAPSANFTVTGVFIDKTMAPGDSMVYTVNFTPSVTGPITAYLRAAYAIEQSCGSSSSPTGATVTVSTLTGTATPAQFALSYNSGNGNVTLLPSSQTPLNFGNVSTSSSATITFTLTNESASAMSTPTVTVPPPSTFASNPFALNTASLPSSIPAGSSATFTVTFEPGQTGTVLANLNVGSNSYPIEGTGAVIADIDALQIQYVDATGVIGRPQAASPINFGQVIGGTTTTATLKFTVTNPTISYNAVTLPDPAVSVTGAGFVLSGAPSGAATIQPGASITFQVTFSPTATGTFTGTLSIGSRSFSLTGQSVASPLPGISFQLSSQPLTSQQQVNLTVQLAGASPINVVGQLSLQFVPSVSNVSDDPAVVFLASSGRQLNVSVASGAQTATYNNQSNIGFQTGTTAGTITFTVTFPNTAPYSQSFTITPALIKIASATAQRQDPNLVVTINGYDNTYSAGQLSFIFYDMSGNVLTPNGIQYNATSAFQQLFFTNNSAGGAFALQAKFPVTGDVTKVGSVALTMTNSAGQTTTNQTFQ